jgi:ParB family transcriptional regulator, chromosome partitioning protein
MQNAPVTDGKEGNKTSAEKVHEKAHDKVIEKRRALGRGLESLLPGPRAVAPAVAPANTLEPIQTPQQTRRLDGAPPAATPHAEAIAPAAVSVPGAAAEASVSATAAAVVSPLATVAELRASTDGEEVVRLAIDLIDRNPYQTRTFFKAHTLDELAGSIKVQGVLQPIMVRPGDDGRYRLILGERRLRAASLAGLETIPAIVKRVSDQQAAEMTLVENLQRQDLDCVEQAEAFSKLSKEFKMTQEEIGARVGVSRETVANYIRVLTLPSGVLEALIGGQMTFSHARILLSLGDHHSIWAMAKRVIEEKMSVAKLEALVFRGIDGPPQDKNTTGAGRWVDPNVKAAQRTLETILGMRVRIRDRAGRGKIVIEYATIEDFDRVVEMLGGK